MAGSTVPTVLAALATLAASATSADVIVGEPLAGQPTDYIAVGFNDQSPGVINNQSLTDYGMRASLEDYDVLSEILARDGGTDLTVTAARAYNLLDEIDAALITDPDLGGACMLAQRTGSELRILRAGGEGALVALSFTVRVQAQRS